jgi:hypothetical protein
MRLKVNGAVPTPPSSPCLYDLLRNTLTCVITLGSLLPADVRQAIPNWRMYDRLYQTGGCTTGCTKLADVRQAVPNRWMYDRLYQTGGCTTGCIKLADVRQAVPNWRMYDRLYQTPDLLTLCAINYHYLSDWVFKYCRC